MDLIRCIYLMNMTVLHHPLVLRSFLILLVSFISGFSPAQEEKYYFDKHWIQCNESKAKYYRIIEEVDTVLKVTDYYMPGRKRSEAFIANESNNLEILKIRGDFEQKVIGENKYYRKNGKLEYTTNDFPFHEELGIDEAFFQLLTEVDTVQIDSSSLLFKVVYFKKRFDYGFMLDGDILHGVWLSVDSETGTVLARILYSNGRLHGTSFTYWKNGKVKERAPYRNGLYHGEVKRYNKKGVLVKGKEYYKGDLIESWIYKKPKKK